MRTFAVIAASLLVAGGGALAAGQAASTQPSSPKAQAEKEPQTRTKKKTIVVERDDQGGAPRVFSWDENGDFDAPIGPGLMVPSGPRIGVTVSNLDSAPSTSASGVVVTAVRENGPAAKAGVKEKDVITEFDGERVRSAKQLTRLVSETPEGRTVKMAVQREGTRVDLQVTPENDERPMALGGGPQIHRELLPPAFRQEQAPKLRRFEFEGPEKGERFEWKTPGDHFFFRNPESGDGDGTFNLFVGPGRGRLGIGVQDLSEQLADYFGTKDGVLVTSVTKDSPAAKAGLRAGDVITSINDASVTSTEALIESVQKADDGATLKLGYVRDKKPGTASATLEASQKPKVKREARPI